MKHKNGDPSCKSLLDSIERHVKEIVSEEYWVNAGLIQERSLEKRKIRNSKQLESILRKPKRRKVCTRANIVCKLPKSTHLSPYYPMRYESNTYFVFNSTMLGEEVLLHIKHCEYNLCDPIINTCLNTSKKNYSNTYFYAYSSLYSSA